MERSRSICAWTSLNAQYTPAGSPSGPRTAADWVRTSTRRPSLVSSANSFTCRPGASMAAISRASTSSASALRTAHPANPARPTASSAVQPRMRSASRFQWVTTPSASKAHSAASMPSSSAASRSEPAGPPARARAPPARARRWPHYAGMHSPEPPAGCVRTYGTTIRSPTIIQLERDPAHIEFPTRCWELLSAPRYPRFHEAKDLYAARAPCGLPPACRRKAGTKKWLILRRPVLRVAVLRKGGGSADV